MPANTRSLKYLTVKILSNLTNEISMNNFEYSLSTLDSALSISCQQIDEAFINIKNEYQRLKDENEKLKTENEKLLKWQDIASKTMHGLQDCNNCILKEN